MRTSNKMPLKAPSKSTHIQQEELEQRYIIGIDLVGYSKKTATEQRRQIEILYAHVNACIDQFDIDLATLVYLPTGDGMFIGIPAIKPNVPLLFARQLHLLYGTKQRDLKMAIWMGLVFVIKDINGNRNFAGAGINLAARLESCCSPGHILVHDQIAETITADPEYVKSTFGENAMFAGPYRFVVKHDEKISAYNFYGMGVGGFGTQDPPLEKRDWEGSYLPLADRLAKWNIEPRGILLERGLRRRYEDKVIIGEVVVDTPLADDRGIAADQIDIVEQQSLDELMPAFLLELRDQVSLKSNKPKVHLLNCRAPQLDSNDNHLTLTIATSDYRMSRAILGAESKIYEELKRTGDAPHSFPGRLNLDIVVITCDNHLVLVKRKSHRETDYYADAWSVVGETLDAKKDRNAQGTIRPELAALRALHEHDELNLQVSESELNMRFLAVVTICRYLLRDLIVLAELKTVTAARVKDYLGAENALIDTIPFNVPACLRLLRFQRHQVQGRDGTEGDLSDIAAVSILLALFAKYSRQKVIAEIGLVD